MAVDNKLIRVQLNHSTTISLRVIRSGSGLLDTKDLADFSNKNPHLTETTVVPGLNGAVLEGRTSGTILTLVSEPLCLLLDSGWHMLSAIRMYWFPLEDVGNGSRMLTATTCIGLLPYLHILQRCPVLWCGHLPPGTVL